MAKVRHNIILFTKSLTLHLLNKNIGDIPIDKLEQPRWLEWWKVLRFYCICEKKGQQQWDQY